MHKGFVKCRKANIRKEPSAISEVIDTINERTPVIILDDSNKVYYHILEYGIEGYCRKDLIEVDKNGK